MTRQTSHPLFRDFGLEHSGVSRLQSETGSPTSSFSRQEMRVSASRGVIRCIPQPLAKEPRLVEVSRCVCQLEVRSSFYFILQR